MQQEASKGLGRGIRSTETLFSLPVQRASKTCGVGVSFLLCDGFVDAMVRAEQRLAWRVVFVDESPSRERRERKAYA